MPILFGCCLLPDSGASWAVVNVYSGRGWTALKISVPQACCLFLSGVACFAPKVFLIQSHHIDFHDSECESVIIRMYFSLTFDESHFLNMPIYDFECSQCGCQQELLRKVSAPAVDTCPQCHQPTFVKKVSAPNFQLTGSGWYATDFKNNISASAKPAESDSTAAKCAPGCACH